MKQYGKIQFRCRDCENILCKVNNGRQGGSQICPRFRLSSVGNALEVDVKAMREEIERADEGYNSCDPSAMEYMKADILAIIDKYMGVKE